MENEPTAWEDINAPTTVSARPPAPHSRSSAQTDHRKVFRNELTACLTLTAPVGMTEEAKRDWFAVAWQTLKDIPPDILAIGAKKARLKVDHPSKIVPTIAEETAEMMRWRSESLRERIGESHQLPRPKPHIAERDRSKFVAADWAELNEYLERMGSPVRYSSTGTKL